jgi:hypothetical protein
VKPIQKLEDISTQGFYCRPVNGNQIKIATPAEKVSNKMKKIYSNVTKFEKKRFKTVRSCLLGTRHYVT